MVIITIVNRIGIENVRVTFGFIIGLRLGFVWVLFGFCLGIEEALGKSKNDNDLASPIKELTKAIERLTNIR